MTAMTIAEKILARASGKDSVRAGEFVWAVPDLVIGHDLNYPRYRKMMKDNGYEHVASPKKILITIDHTTNAQDPVTLGYHRAMREDAKAEGLGAFYDIGRNGISHNVPLDHGRVKPGMLVVASDTRAPALGCAGAMSIAIGIGLVTVLSLGRGWFRVPETIRVNLAGEMRPGVMSRDIAQWIANRIGYEAGDYRCIEFVGSLLEKLGEDERHTLCNAMVDIGCKAAVCSMPAQGWVTSDRDAVFADTIGVDASQIGPQVSVPPDPENVMPIADVLGREITHAFVGSCIGGKMEDLRAAAKVMKGRKVSDGVRMIVIPATQDIYKKAMAEGLMTIFVDAGCVISAGICGPCYGTFAPLGDGDVSIGTPTRNDPGRMGSEQATIYIANAAVVAASAVTGRITDPKDLVRSAENAH
jgi:3-isopropylmalate/(R)-2-methylmalate dehydratase large subunit